MIACILIFASACSGVVSPSDASPTPPPPTDAFCPPPNGWFVYRARPGDTLAELADQSGSSVSELATANCLNNPRAIPAGAILYLPRAIR